MRGSLSVLSLLMLAIVSASVLPASAAQPSYGPDPAAIAAWQDILLVLRDPLSGASETVQATLDEGVVDVIPVALGDADGDGRGDLAVTTMSLDIEVTEDSISIHAGESRATAYSGVGLAPLWTKVAANGTVLFPTLDLDLDGVVDFVEGLDIWAAEPVAPTVDAPFASADATKVSFTSDYAILSGSDLASIGKWTAADTGTETTAGAFPMVAGGFASAWTGEYTSALPLPDGSLLEVTVAAKDAGAFAFSPALGESAWLSEADATFRLRGIDGAEHASLEVTGLAAEPNVVSAGDLDGDAAWDALIAWDERSPRAYAGPGSTYMLPYVKGHLAALGHGGSVLWEADSGDDLLVDHFSLTLGDVTGDGAAEVEWLQLVLAPTSPAGVRIATSILDGKDGTVLGGRADAGVSFYLPFGQADAEAGLELVGMHADDLMGEPRFTVNRGDLSEIWAYEGDGWPVNFASMYDETGGFLDLTGDGLADLAFAGGDGLVTLEAFNGPDGAALWTLEAPQNMTQASFTGDFAGAGGADLVLTTFSAAESPSSTEVAAGRSWSVRESARDAPGPIPDPGMANATIAIEVYAGETGEFVMRQVLRSPDTVALRTAGWAAAYATDVGDLTGDGKVELAVTLYEEDQVEGSTGTMSYMVGFGRPSLYVLSAQSDQPLLAMAHASEDSTATLDAELLPAREKGRLLTSDINSQAAPGLGLALIVVALAALALRRRA